MNHNTLRTGLAACFAVIALAALIGSAFLTDNDKRFGDFRFLYLAGSLWAEGTSPYDLLVFQNAWIDRIGGLDPSVRPYPEESIVSLEDIEEDAIMYPFLPISAALVMPLATGGWEFARAGVTAVGFFGLGVAALCLGHLFRLTPASTLFLLGCMALMSATSASFFSGQLSVAAVAAALAMIKPQLTLPLLAYAWIATDRRIALAIWSGLAILISNLVPVLITGNVDVISDMGAALALRAEHPFNLYENMHGLYFALSGSLSNSAIQATGLAVAAIGALGLGLWRGLDQPYGLATVSLLTVLTMPLHVGYDMVVVYPVLALAIMMTVEKAHPIRLLFVWAGALALLRWNNVDRLADGLFWRDAGEWGLLLICLCGIAILLEAGRARPVAGQAARA